MRTVGMREARDREIDRHCRTGEEVIITRRGVPVARIVLAPEQPPRTKVSIDEAIQELRKFRAAHPLRGLSIKQLIKQGRRY